MTETFLCPHCGGRSGSCCVCLETQRVGAEEAMAATRFVWARPGCTCEACGRATSGPSMGPREREELGKARAAHDRHADLFGPFERCEHTSCVRARRVYAPAA